MSDLLIRRIHREQAEAVQARVFEHVPEQDRWTVMCMLFQPPRDERFGDRGQRLYGHDG